MNNETHETTDNNHFLSVVYTNLFRVLRPTLLSCCLLSSLWRSSLRPVGALSVIQRLFKTKQLKAAVIEILMRQTPTLPLCLEGNVIYRNSLGLLCY